ncbi:hypothetical protein IFT84_13550 [Rhizobium sp. CFBP 8762]|uniref:hypothetical protein n=1 Tax=Rhizobium sp. CFBP 8762 TaxID=2775279 RepID=UPI001781C48C|nr:hypothetical protein [Rhizobium sp. CFBP 8762]MBD8555532.1 hypothetical protein [Rhizobium sp. CFBP 8762]
MNDTELTDEQIRAMERKLLQDTSRWPIVEVRKKRLIPTGKHPVSVRQHRKEGKS